MNTVGIIGIGAMGSVIVERFIAAGLKTFVYDVSASAVERAVALGGESCASPAEVGQAAEVVDVMVRTDQQMLDAVLGEAGVLAGLSGGKALLLHSTIDPRTTRTIAAAARAKGVDVADACIGGVPAVLRAGDADILVGAAPEFMERIRPHLLHLGKEVFHMGPVGSGNVAKFMKNLVGVSERLIIGEALMLGEAAGIPYQRGLEMLRHMPPVLDRPDATFDPSDDAPVRGGHRNLFEQILPPTARLADEADLDVPVTRLLAAGCGSLPKPADVAGATNR